MKKIIFNCPEELWRKVAKEAEKQRRTLTGQIQWALDQTHPESGAALDAGATEKTGSRGWDRKKSGTETD